MGLFSGFLVSLKLYLPLAFHRSLILLLLLLKEVGLALNLLYFCDSALLGLFCLLAKTFLQFGARRGVRSRAECGGSRDSGGRGWVGESCGGYSIPDNLSRITGFRWLLDDAGHDWIWSRSDR